MSFQRGLMVALFGCWLVSAGAAASGDDENRNRQVTSKRGPFKIEVSLDASFEPSQPAEVALRPQDWAEFTIEEVTPHGAAVRKGETVLTLQRRKYNEAVRDQEAAVRSSELAIALAKNEINLSEVTGRLDLDEARRTRRQAEEDLRHYLQVGRSVRERQTNMSVKSAEASLNFAQDELNQLEKMYKADHLTEETEEIILRRQREQTEQAKEYLELAKISRERTLETELPRHEQELRNANERSELALAKAEFVAAPTAEKRRLELAKLLEEHERLVAKLARLKADESLFKLVAPSDGMVYYGGWSSGQWSGDGSGKLRRGATVQANETILSIVSPRVETARVTIAEKDLGRVEVGLKGIVTPTGRPQLQIPATVKSIEAVPTSPGKFTAQIALSADAAAGKSIVPGMTGTFRAVSYYKADAITVPLTAIRTVGGEIDKTVVQVDELGHTKEVKLGRRGDKRVEILSGIEEPGLVLFLENTDEN